MEHKTLVAIN